MSVPQKGSCGGQPAHAVKCSRRVGHFRPVSVAAPPREAWGTRPGYAGAPRGAAPARARCAMSVGAVRRRSQLRLAGGDRAAPSPRVRRPIGRGRWPASQYGERGSPRCARTPRSAAVHPSSCSAGGRRARGSRPGSTAPLGGPERLCALASGRRCQVRPVWPSGAPTGVRLGGSDGPAVSPEVTSRSRHAVTAASSSSAWAITSASCAS
jgi:hypothetical protein